MGLDDILKYITSNTSTLAVAFFMFTPWFDNWVMNTFPSLANMDRLMYSLLKSGFFLLLLYIAENYIFTKKTSG